MRQVLSVAVLLLAIPGSARAQLNTSASPDTTPAAVVQRFVDAANARNASAMGALVTPDAVFARFPDGRVISQTRDSIQAYYSRLLQSLPPGFHITVQPRVVEGQMVIDQEHFTGMPGERQQATWIYLVRNGLIHRAWVVDGRPTPAPSGPANTSKPSSDYQYPWSLSARQEGGIADISSDLFVVRVSAESQP